MQTHTQMVMANIHFASAMPHAKCNKSGGMMIYGAYLAFVCTVSCCGSFYKLNDVSMDEINRYLSQLVQTAMQQLVQSYCVDIAEVSSIL